MQGAGADASMSQLCWKSCENERSCTSNSNSYSRLIWTLMSVSASMVEVQVKQRIDNAITVLQVHVRGDLGEMAYGGPADWARIPGETGTTGESCCRYCQGCPALRPRCLCGAETETCGVYSHCASIKKALHPSSIQAECCFARGQGVHMSRHHASL